MPFIFDTIVEIDLLNFSEVTFDLSIYGGGEDEVFRDRNHFLKRLNKISTPFEFEYPLNVFFKNHKQMNDTENAIKVLKKSLKNKSYRQSWIANIAMAYKDREHEYRLSNNKVGKYLNKIDMHNIANEAAKDFIDLLSAK